MKKILLSTILLFTICSAFSQTYDIYLIKRPDNSTYEHAKYIARMQGKMQEKYDYNNERINDAASYITNEISSLNYPDNLRENIRYGWNQIIREVSNCSNMMDNSSTSKAINLMTTSINRVISREIKLYTGSRLYNDYDFEFC